MTTFSKWTHPNGSTRVYINDLPCAGSAKIWAEKCPADQFGFEYTIRATALNKGRSELNNLINDAELAIFAATGERTQQFEAVLALAK